MTTIIKAPTKLTKAQAKAGFESKEFTHAKFTNKGVQRKLMKNQAKVQKFQQRQAALRNKQIKAHNEYMANEYQKNLVMYGATTPEQQAAAENANDESFALKP